MYLGLTNHQMSLLYKVMLIIYNFILLEPSVFLGKMKLVNC